MLPIPFDNPDTYPGHSGVDFGQPSGTPARSSGSGYIFSRGYTERAGNYAWVRYDGLIPDCLYCHFESGAGPSAGTRLLEGSIIGYVGNTGHSFGPHLHVEVEGYTTTAGFWVWFTDSRVVSQQIPNKDTRPLIKPTSEEDDMYPLEITLPNGKHKASIAKGIFSGLINEDNPDWFRNVVSTDDAWNPVSGVTQLHTLLHKFGVALDCYRMVGKDLEIRDALTGVWSRGGRWDKSDQILANLPKA